MIKLNLKTQGSILIWTVMLGLALTSVFFFFSVRQRATIAVQQDTAAILNARQYLESYADYIQDLDKSVPEEKTEIDKLKNGVNFDGISGTFTNLTDEITGVADYGVPVEYNFTGNGEIFIEWNKCANNLNGSLKVNDFVYDHQENTSPVCDPQKPENPDYDDLVGPIKVVQNPVKIETLNAPFYFHITPKDATTQLLDKKWRLDIKTDLDYGKKVEVKRTF